MSTDIFFIFDCDRFSHLPWLKHNSVTDAALTMRMTEQILCLSFILKFSLQVSSLHHPACLPRNITGPCRLIPWLVPCFQVMRPTGQDSLPVKNAPHALGFRCAHCTSEFDTRRAMDCHRRKQSSIGTGCADPSNSKSVSFTGRASISSSIVREHDFQGAQPTHTVIVYVNPHTLWHICSHDIISIIAIIEIILI